MKAKWSLGLTGSILVANPIPEDKEAESGEINKAIEEAIHLLNDVGLRATTLLLLFFQTWLRRPQIQALKQT